MLCPYRIAAFIAAFAAVVVCVPISAQLVIGAKAGLLSHIEHEVYLDGRPVDANPARWRALNENEVLHTGTGRAEVLLNPCIVLHMDEDTSIRMIRNELADARVELLAGSVIVLADRKLKNTATTMLVKNSIVALMQKGLYRFETEPSRVKVFAGEAKVERLGLTFTVSSGQVISLGSDTRPIKRFDKRKMDALDIWSEWRTEILIKESGSESRLEHNRRTSQEAAKEAQSLQGEMHNPRSIYYDPTAPPLPTPLRGASAPSGAASLCSDMSR
jgi:hypothetical protein